MRAHLFGPWAQLVGLVAFVLMALYVGRQWRPHFFAEDAPSPVLAEGWAEATEVFALNVPADCPAQRLDYRAWQKDPALPATIEFYVSKMNEPVTTTGPQPVTEYTESSTTWSLDATTYALTVRGVTARWRFALACQDAR